MAKKRSASGRRKKRGTSRKKSKKVQARSAAKWDEVGPALVRSMNLWEGARGPAGLARGDDGSRCSVDWVVWVEQPMGLIVGSAIVMSDDDSGLASTLAAALAEPNVGAPRRPRGVRVATEAMATELRDEASGDVLIEVAPTPGTEKLGRELAAQIEQEEGIGYLDLHGVDADVVAEFFEAASELAAEEVLLAESGAFRIDAPGLGIEGVIGCMVDFASQGSGYLVLPSVEHYRALALASEESPPSDASALAVMFIPFEMLPRLAQDDIEKQGWRRAGDGLCPLLVRHGPDGDEITVTAKDYQVATVMARVMADLARNNADELRSSNRALRCTLRIPAVGDVDVLYPGDLDEDELSSIDEEDIEATIRLPQEAFEAAVGVDILSPRARRVLEKAFPSDSEPGFELRASLTDFRHVGELLTAASKQHGRPGALGEAAMRFLYASAPPPSFVEEPRVSASRPRDRGSAKSTASSRTRSRTRGAKKGRALYQIKVTLCGIRPPIWRRIEVCSDISLAELHFVIQDEMGWQNCHLHEFECRGTRYGVRDPDFDDLGGSEVRDEAIRLDELLRKPKSSMLYYYDFGDGWVHRVVVEEVKPMPSGQRAPRPRCIGGRRACPPEDCGGPPGYAHMLEALRNSRHPEHAHYKEWIGEGFDPEVF